MRRLATLVLVTVVFVGLSASWNALSAQDDAKKEAAKDDAKKDDAKKDAPKDDAKKAEAKKEEPKKPDEPLPIPPDVQEKLEKARQAVAEAIAAAEAAGLVDTSIDPPPIMDILVTGRSLDQRELKKDPKDRVGVSPEVFAAWFTGYGKREANPSLVYDQEVRIMQPSKGLKAVYDQRATIFNRHLETARKALADAKAKAAAPTEAKPKDEAPKEVKPEEKPKDEKPKEEPKAAPAPAPKEEKPKA